MITTRRIYDIKGESDIFGILVDRIWPRGIASNAPGLQAWYKEVAPSTALRRWFGHDPRKWEQFKGKYRQELATRQALLNTLKSLEMKHGTLVLLYAAKDEQYNNAVALKNILDDLS